MLICSITECNVKGFINERTLRRASSPLRWKQALTCNFECSNFSFQQFQPSVLNWADVASASALPGYLSKVLRNYTEKACDGELLSVRCPPRTTITVQSAFYGRKGTSDPERCPQSYQALLNSYHAPEDDQYCSVSTALQVNTLKCIYTPPTSVSPPPQIQTSVLNRKWSNWPKGYILETPLP